MPRRHWGLFPLLALAAGCGLPLGVGGSGVTRFEAPVAVADEATAGVTLTCDGMLPAAGASVYPVEGDDLVVLHASADLGVFFSLGAFVRSGRDRSVGPEWWIILRPMVGSWRWDEAPEGHGLFTGVRTGFFREFSRAKLRVEYGWSTLHDFSGDGDARTQELSVTVIFWLGRE